MELKEQEDVNCNKCKDASLRLIFVNSNIKLLITIVWNTFSSLENESVTKDFNKLSFQWSWKNKNIDVNVKMQG